MEVLDCCLDYIRERYSQPLTIEAICGECGAGRTVLFSLFKKQLNCTPAAFIRTVRLQAAGRVQIRGYFLPVRGYIIENLVPE